MCSAMVAALPCVREDIRFFLEVKVSIFFLLWSDENALLKNEKVCPVIT